MKDLIKAVAILLLYAGAAPALGSFLARNRIWERWVLALMMFMPGWHPGKLTLMVVSVETYRGHTKGFEYCHLDVLGLAMIIAAAIRDGPRFKWASPGAYLYLTYCLGSCLCVFSAYDNLYLAMAAWKFTKVVVVMVGFYHGFRDAEDLRWVMRSMAAALVLQGLVGLKMRFLDGVWQVKGWFEHQNPMAMWCYLLAGPVLGWAFLPQVKGRDVWLCLAAVGFAALLILLSVSRAGLAAFAIGCAAATGLAWLRGFKLKTFSITAAGAFAAFLAGLLALDSLMARMQEVDSRDESEDLRDILNKQSRAMLHDHPLGIGWNNFGVANSLPVPEYSQILMDWDEERGFRIIEENYFANPLTESLYWLLLSENGYPGFILFVLFMLLTVLWMVRAAWTFRKSPTGMFVGCLLVVLGITYGHGLVERCLTQTKNLSAWMMLCGMLARIETCRRAGHDLPEPDSPSPQNPKPR